MAEPVNLSLAGLGEAYRDGRSVADIARLVLDRIAAGADPAVWISLVAPEAFLAAAEALDAVPPHARGPLHGVPFAVKDNIDAEGFATTMACPAAAYRPQRSATVVERLVAAGAMLVGKTNLDQFATGLVGVRSPHGAPRSVFDPRYVSGGSSSGSAVAVASGMVTFALGTDTAGSGRVPAAFNNIVGLKPTRGRLSTAGVFPANRLLDCVSVFANTVADAALAAAVAGGPDPRDPFSRTMRTRLLPNEGLRLGVPSAASRTFRGDASAEAAFDAALRLLDELPVQLVPFDFAPFAEAAEMLYGSAWVAERTAATRDILAAHADAIHPVTRGILQGGSHFDAADAFEAIYRAADARAAADSNWSEFDAMVLPTTPTILTVEAVEMDPLELNRQLGTYTNFVNLLDLAAISVPAGFRADGLPHGVTLVAPAFTDDALAGLAARIHEVLGAGYGRARTPPGPATIPVAGAVTLGVVGAHLSGEPLNGQLTSRGAVLRETTQTAAGYDLFALTGTIPPKPGLVNTGTGAGGIELELWDMPLEGFGALVAEIPPPLGIGSVTLADGRIVKCFVAEEIATTGAARITHYGGWRAFLAEQER